MLYILKREGHDITKWHLIRLRFQLNLRRRIGRTEEDHAHADEVVRRLILEESGRNAGQIEGYGKGLLHTHFRQAGYIAARDRLFRIWRTINPEAVARRRHDLQRSRGEAIIPGPNYVWSLDGYDKLKPYGIEVYACIDAYSRYVIWVFIGASNATATSCFVQFLQVLEDMKIQPTFLRTDRGGETSMMAQAHFELRRIDEPELQFSDCYLYGTSKANQRIEAWWDELSKGVLFRWRVSIVRASKLNESSNVV